MPKITFLYDDENKTEKIKILEFEYSGKSLLYDIFMQASNSHDLLFAHFPCGGKGTCFKCKVMITKGMDNISPLTESEQKHLSADEIKCGIRFACMCEVWGDIEIKIQEYSNSNINGTKMKIQTDGIQSRTLIDNKKNNILEKSTEIYGIAADIGTTTVAVYLCRLNDGEIIDIEASENPQRVYGADVISRINYTIEHEENDAGINTLKKSILSNIFKLIDKMCEKNNISQKDIHSIVLTGNTVMQHFAAGIAPKSIAFAPFIAPTLFDYEIKLSELLNNTEIQSKIDENTEIYFPPAFASYVGGDIATGIIASDTDLTEKTILFLDIGTNGEIGFGGKDKLIFCATAAGPAFEGANIKMGLPGVEGAINKIYIDENNDILYSVIGDTKPIGICGSGVIDIAALMLEIGVLDETGRIIDTDELDDIDSDTANKYKNLYERLDEINNENIFYIDKKFNIYITQKDIREIQLAKSAICAGIMTLLHYSDKKISDIDELILAGGFGVKIDKKSACKIGLIPAELKDKINAAGNTAGMGAVAVLISAEAKARIKKVREISEYVELSGDSFFMDEYIERMTF